MIPNIDALAEMHYSSLDPAFRLIDDDLEAQKEREEERILSYVSNRIREIFDDLNARKETKNSNASYAVRFAAGFEGIRMVLSGMSTLEQMEDNTSYMKNFKPLDAEEMEAVQKVADVYKSLEAILSTA